MVGLKTLCTFSSFSLFLIISVTPPTSATTDTILTNQTLGFGQTIVSSSGNFKFGFFNNKYLGIWYNFSSETVVWVANRQAPINDASGVLLQVTPQGVLVLRDSNNLTVWSTNTSSRQVTSPVARILNTGNLVIQEADATSGDDDYIWQSFDYLCDTLLPGAKLGRIFATGRDNYLVSWKNKSDPSPGKTINKLDNNGYPQIFIFVEDTIVLRSGPWNGLSFAGITEMRPNSIFSYQFFYNNEGIYYKDQLIDQSVFSRLVVSDSGIVQRFNWNSSANEWNVYSKQSIDKCDVFGTCGAFGTCNIGNNPICGCLDGFVPRYLKEWEAGNWSGGCVMQNEPSCDSSGQTFKQIDGVKLPDTRTSWFNKTMDLMACQRQCLDNCSCTAYATLDISSGTGCLIWFDELLDVREYSGNEHAFYLRSSPAAASGKTNAGGNSSHRKRIGAIVIPLLAAGVIILLIVLFIHCRKRKPQETLMDVANAAKDDLELPLFDLATIDRATEGFSSQNKLGEGGFGPVHKGVLNDGHEIAVKRLSKTSGQGMSEFKNEVILIAKLQHRNLVRLLGCCIQGEERMLVYEFMPNKSLDQFIFDQKMKHLLGWEKRVEIVGGIARGLLYLHQDSRLRIIHRDLKASNVLLDGDMNPKISDFGMARIFGPDQHMANTRNVVGTYGYMSPEYAVDGVFSTKSDVFSFGVLVLEIITGKRNRAFTHAEHNHNLLGHAWKCWMEKRPLELIDNNLDDAFIEPEVLRCVHIGLLCVQQRPEDRPSMSSVVLMLGSDSTLPQPTKPGFFAERCMPSSDCSSSNVDSASMNQMSITLLDAR